MRHSHWQQFLWPVIAGLGLAAALLLLRAPGDSGRSADTNAIDGEAAVQGYATAVANALPSVVNIYTIRVVSTGQYSVVPGGYFGLPRAKPENRILRGLGSGVIVRGDGFIITNHHVIDKADRIGVMLHDGRTRDATVIGVDEATDIAVLKIDVEALNPIEFASPDAVRIGDIVLAIGNPYGIGQTVTQGIVSALGRYGIGLNAYESYIQTDAAINNGNSGGALVNTRGELVGINSVLYSRTGNFNGIGFAIPNDISRHVLKQLIENGEVIRGWLGVIGEELTAPRAEYFGFKIRRGLLINQLARGGPGDSAGLRPGDVITHIDGEVMGSGNASMNRIAHSAPGTAVNISVYRNGATHNILVKLGRKPADRSV
ncbi:MAG: trypsin-like peptidase domain-containing protein [Gammaproteobacteria bacterium]|nr:trypsin-like peptidase domain-containing protein [Gammaproteobacteria bacterium]NNM11335.1 PDZ domain-containing protein [Pseudomonadales bacterium]